MRREMIQRNRLLFIGAATFALVITLPSSALWAWASYVNPYGSIAQSDWMLLVMLILAPAIRLASLLLAYPYFGRGPVLVAIMFVLPGLVNLGIAEALALFLAGMRELRKEFTHNKQVHGRAYRSP